MVAFFSGRLKQEPFSADIHNGKEKSVFCSKEASVISVKKSSALFACLFLAAAFCFAQTVPENEAADGPQAEVSIAFTERSIYYPGPDRPVPVTFTVTNPGPGPLRFKLADDRFFSLAFRARNTANRTLPESEEWIRRRSGASQIYFREITLEAGESYSFTENVKDYLSIPEPGLYLLECAFFPELRRLPDYSEPNLTSNRLTLEIKPEPAPAAAAGYLGGGTQTEGILQPQPLSPDQVVATVLAARQKSQWERFFLYLDLEAMLNDDPVRRRRFQAESESGRREMIENYKTELMQSRAENEISLVPADFQIERTSYTESEGTVTVIEWFDYISFRERKRFTYNLTRRDNIWRINGYTVDNLGTE